MSGGPAVTLTSPSSPLQHRTSKIDDAQSEKNEARVLRPQRLLSRPTLPGRGAAAAAATVYHTRASSKNPASLYTHTTRAWTAAAAL